jgi:hypothetical protein
MDSAFETPVVLAKQATIRTACQAADIVRDHLQQRISIAGLNTLLMLERAAQGDDVEEARSAFCECARTEQLA